LGVCLSFWHVLCEVVLTAMLLFSDLRTIVKACLITVMFPPWNRLCHRQCKEEPHNSFGFESRIFNLKFRFLFSTCFPMSYILNSLTWCQDPWNFWLLFFFFPSTSKVTNNSYLFCTSNIFMLIDWLNTSVICHGMYLVLVGLLTVHIFFLQGCHKCRCSLH
jgi:hypothetical protein